jgi:hypothetical protein
MKFLKIYSNKEVASGTSSTNNTTLTDASANFTSTVKVGDVVYSPGGVQSGTIVSIDSDTVLTLSRSLFTIGAYKIYSATQFVNPRMVILDKMIALNTSYTNRADIVFAPDSFGDNISLTLTNGAVDSGLEMSLNEYILDALKSTLKPNNFVEVKLPVVSTSNGALAVVSVTPVN